MLAAGLPGITFVRLTTSTAPASVKPSRRNHMDITLRAPRWHRHIRRTRFAAAPCHEERNAGPAFNLAAAERFVPPEKRWWEWIDEVESQQPDFTEGT